MIDFDVFCEQAKYRENEKRQIESSYWTFTTAQFLKIAIQGDAIKMNDEYLTTARMVFANWDQYYKRAIKHLKQMLKPNYEYYCHLIFFHEYWYGRNITDVREGGFEMFFWQDKPDDDRYVNYVVQFTEDGCDIGLRIFSE
jgi:hypothetical protein